MKVFLGGTCGTSTWRDDLILLLEAEGIDYFNPQKGEGEWSPEDKVEEDRQKVDECSVHLYVFTSETANVYGIAEAVDSAHRKDKVCLFHVMDESEGLAAVTNMVQSLGGYVGNGPDLTWIVSHLVQLKDVASKSYVNNALDSMPKNIRENYISVNGPLDSVEDPVSVTVILQAFPSSEAGSNGCKVRDLLEFTMRLFKEQKKASPSEKNSMTVKKLKEGLRWQDAKK